MEDKENSEEKKIIKVLMDDDNKIKKVESEELRKEQQASQKVTEEREEYLSEIERNVLKVLMMGGKNFHDIFRMTGYPEVIINGAIRRLISKGYVDEDLNPTEKAKYVSFKKSVKIEGLRRRRISLLDAGIIIAIILFLLSILFYTGVFS